MTPIDDASVLTAIKPWMEIAYYGSGIVVMILVAFGLYQLKLTKDQLETSKDIFRTSSKRAAVEAAVEECRRFSETIVQDSLALDKYCKENEITYFEDVIFTSTKDSFKIDASNINENDPEKLAGAEELINRYLNGLESFALFFLSGVADERIAFHTNAKTFLQLAEQGFKMFPLFNLDKEDAAPIKQLYFLWYQKQEAKKLKIEKKNIDKQLSSYKETNIRSIGT